MSPTDENRKPRALPPLAEGDQISTTSSLQEIGGGWHSA